MNCRIIPVEQGSDEWLALRRCRITASRLADVMAGKKTKRYRLYRREKALEMLGHEHVETKPEWAAHGREQEPRALAAYEYKYGVDVEHDVFLVSNKYDWLGASPDLFEMPGYDPGAEIKCRNLKKNYRKFVELATKYDGTPKAAAPETRHQIQGNMWLTGHQRWGLVNYYEGKDLNGTPERKLHRVWIPRDEVLISAMEVRCLEFMAEVYDLLGKDFSAGDGMGAQVSSG